MNQMSMGVQNPTGCRASVNVVSAFTSGIQTRGHDPEFAHTLDYRHGLEGERCTAPKEKVFFLFSFFKALDDLPEKGREIEGASSLKQTDNQNCLKGMGKTSERLTEWSGAPMGFPERAVTVLNWTELSRVTFSLSMSTKRLTFASSLTRPDVTVLVDWA